MAKQVDIQDAQLTILVSIDGQMHMTAFDKDEFESLSALVKMGIKAVVPTQATQSQINKILRAEL